MGGERGGLNVVGIALVSSAFGFILTKLKRDHDKLMFDIFDTNSLFKSIPYYILTMIVSLIAQGLLLIIIYVIVTRKNVFKFFRNIIEALALAVGTSSR